MVELDLAQILRQLLHGFPFSGGSIEPAAIDPNPSISANPFGAALDFGVTAGNGHGDVFGIGQVDAVFGCGVPNGVLWRKFAGAFNFHWAAIVEVESPMSDVAMMANPVEELATARVVIPAPIHMHPRFDVRHHLGRADPKIIIEFLGRFGDLHLVFGPLEIGMTGRQPNFDVRYFADQAVADDFGGFVEIRLRPLP